MSCHAATPEVRHRPIAERQSRYRRSGGLRDRAAAMCLLHLPPCGQARDNAGRQVRRVWAKRVVFYEMHSICLADEGTDWMDSCKRSLKANSRSINASSLIPVDMAMCQNLMNLLTSSSFIFSR